MTVYDKISEMIERIKTPSMRMYFFRLLDSAEESEEEKYLQSHVGGKPFIDKKNEWPKCPSCNKDMEFLLQLREKNKEDDILLSTFFFCSCTLKQNYPTLAVTMYRNPKLNDIDQSKYEGREFNARYKIIFEASWDSPSAQTLPMYEEEIFKDEEVSGLKSNEFAGYYEKMRWENDYVSDDPFNKLGGYPEFIGAPKIVNCHCCNQPTKFYFQFEPRDVFNIHFNGAVLYCYVCSSTGKLHFIIN